MPKINYAIYRCQQCGVRFKQKTRFEANLTPGQALGIMIHNREDVMVVHRCDLNDPDNSLCGVADLIGANQLEELT